MKPGDIHVRADHDADWVVVERVTPVVKETVLKFAVGRPVVVDNINYTETLYAGPLNPPPAAEQPADSRP